MHTFWSNYRDLTRPGPPKGSVERKGNGTPYFREIQVGEILLYYLARFDDFVSDQSYQL